MHETGLFRYAMREEDGGKGGDGKKRVRLEENTEWLVGERRLAEVVVLTLHSFVYPPGTLRTRHVATESSSSPLKLELTPEILNALVYSTYTVHKDTYAVC